MTEGQQAAAGDGNAYWRPLRPGETVHVLTDIVEEPIAPGNPVSSIDEQTIKIIAETVERLVREMAPEMIERAIRKEIEELKKETD